MNFIKKGKLSHLVITFVLLGLFGCSGDSYSEYSVEITEEATGGKYQTVRGKADWDHVSMGPESAMNHLKLRVLNVPWKVKPGEIVNLEIELEPDEGYMLVGPLETSGHYSPLEIQFFEKSGTDVKIGPWPESTPRSVYQREKKVQVYDKKTRVPMRVTVPVNPNFNQMRPMLRAVAQFQLVSETRAPGSGAFSIHFAMEIQE